MIGGERDRPGCDPTAYFRLTRRRWLQAAAALVGASFLPGCGSSRGSSASLQPVPSGPFTQASLVVTPTIAGAIGPAFAGLSYEKSQLYGPLFSGSNTDLAALFRMIGPSVLRIGGNSMDRNVWTPDGAGQTSGQIAPRDVDGLAAFLQATGWQCLYGVNLGGAATGATTPALAAAEVAYVAGKLGASLLGIEIGNECDLYGDTGSYFAGNWSLSQFIALWQEFRAAILAAAPGVVLTGPADASNESSWTIPFGTTVTKSEISLLTQHYYRANGQSPTSTVELLVSPDAKLVTDLSTLATGAAAIGVPFRIAECNSFYNGGSSGVSDAYASALWVVDFLFGCALGGASGVNLHGGGDGPGYTPIANSGATIVGARPEFYGILLFTLAGPGALHATQLSAGTLNATGYAIEKGSGGINMVIVNKDETQNLALTVTLPGAASTATLLQMTQRSAGATGPDLSATAGITIQGGGIGPDGSFAPSSAYTLSPSGSRLTCYVPALSAVLVETS